jgi:hypothetical protein
MSLWSKSALGPGRTVNCQSCGKKVQTHWIAIFAAIPVRPPLSSVADARGFAWFWTFLASVAIALGLLSWWIVRTQKPNDEA